MLRKTTGKSDEQGIPEKSTHEREMSTGDAKLTHKSSLNIYQGNSEAYPRICGGRAKYNCHEEMQAGV